ncbi:hypothetical protein MIND_00701400 [Mycena indigotica]|uniref:Uncharacterized protein n=1 Tax=Mycena indigotica TaxID=2126181 RepID=A0A8H6SN95_9AGAR|nr:uncharacterized protein MIND_00701400 [Mycena indigotica]KAF7301362.1 hypothetical protein MIND_00701400 [Mycena indigotica]
MGQRHQIFLVARVVAHGDDAARYRCVGAYHHQWCYGRLPLSSTRRFLTLLKHSDNAKIVKAEIDALQGQYGKETSAKNANYVPCPYSLFLVASAFCVDLENGYMSGDNFAHGILDAMMGSSQGDNNDGITVFDITNPADPAYCHVSIYGLEAARDNVESRVPLSAERYVRAYYPETATKDMENPDLDELDVRAKFDALRGERLMTIDVLAEAWPEEYNEGDSKPAVKQKKPRQHLPTLVELTLGPAVEHGLKTGDLEVIEDMVWHPGKAAAMWPALRRQNPFPEVGMSLLIKVVQQQVPTTATSLDLSGFSLSNQQILTVLEQCNIDNLQHLDLSHNPNISVDVIRLVLGQYPNLQRLILLGTSIANHDLNQMLSAEPSLFRNSIAPSAFSFLGILDMNTVAMTSLPIFSPLALIQSMTDILFPLVDPTYRYANMAEWITHAAFGSSYRLPGLAWGERRVFCIPSPNVLHHPKVRTWIFALQWFRYRRDNFYAFLSRDGPDGDLLVYDLRGFLKAMEEEGRPPVPEADVQKLENVLARLKDTVHLTDRTKVADRHQIFLIARVIPDGEDTASYRCVGAHITINGALGATRNFLTLLKQTNNARVVESELAALQGQYREDTANGYVPCPYALFLVASAFCVDLEDNHASGGSFSNGILDALMGSGDGDNNDGITVFDISKPTDPAYCHVAVYGLEAAEAGGEVENYIPLSAEQYVRAYVPLKEDASMSDEEETYVRAMIDALSAERLITIDTLAEARPWEYNPSESITDSEVSPSRQRQHLPTLVDLTLGLGVEYGLKTGELQVIEDLVWHPGKAATIWPVLQRQNPFPDVGMSLLIKVVQQQVPATATSLDLSGFSLSYEQTLAVVEQCQIEHLRMLDLSRNSYLSAQVIRLVLERRPDIQRLVLLRTSISNEELSTLLSADSSLFRSNVGELVHPLLLSIEKPTFPSAFVYAGNHGNHSCIVSLPIFSPSAIIQGITDIL